VVKLAEILAEGRRRRGWSQADLAHHAGLSASTVARTEQSQGLPNVNSLRRIAAAIGYDPDALVRLARDPGAPHRAAWIASPDDPRGRSLLPGLITADRLTDAKAVSLITRLSPPPRSQRVPHFGRVSAVRTDLREPADHERGNGEFSDVPDAGVDFTVSVDGQCMEPRYESGERVGCSIRRWEREGFVWGKDYWIRFTDGQTTLKRVRPDPRHKERFICAPVNPKAKPFSRRKADVEKAARVLVVISG
jgi:transcriptional regulator with XRE-family HTH domain